MRFRHCIWALLLALPWPAAAQQPAPTGYTVFVAGTAMGREDVTVRSDAAGTTISSTSRFSAPMNLTLRKGEIKYGPDWAPLSLAAEGSINGAEFTLNTSFSGGNAVTQGTEAGTPVARTQPVSAQALILPNIMFGSYLALAKRLATDMPGTELRGYIVPQAEIGVRVSSVNGEQVQVGTTVFPVRRYEILLAQPQGDLAATVTTTEDGGLVRLTVPSQALEIVRTDVASPTSRSQFFSNPGDEAAIIPAAGFNLGATITRPKSAPPTATLPAVVLIAGSGASDRDGVLYGVPMLGQLARALADAGFLVVRYDKRGYGQSGGRSESATLSDYAEDARTVIKWLDARKDVDDQRIAVVGHSEGAMVAMLLASRERKVAAVVSIAGPASRGAELLLEQQAYALTAAQTPETERQAKVALQQQIQQAVLTGKGWEGVPPELRRQADTPWFQSVLAFDPAKVADGIRQPVLLVHGELDKQVPVSHGDRLAEIVKNGKSRALDVVIVRGVNHLLVPATTGEVSEYGTLTDRTVSPEVTSAVSTWLEKTLPPRQR